MIDSLGSASVPVSNRIIQTAGEQAQQNVVPGQTDPTLVTPEKVNTVANYTQDTVDQNQVEQEQQQTAARTAAVGVAQVQQQQELAEIYIEQTTDTEIEDDNLNLSDAADLAQRQQNTEKLETASNVTDLQNQLDNNINDLTKPKGENVFTIQI